ncbi:MAG: hypothetical protein O2931_01025 [Planctomycetota bacterium]|nr:hypothetical protein [Planctomycetota bacterium]MDA1177354.1 hypothetical protein [Planctomycetota bacterium]
MLEGSPFWDSKFLAQSLRKDERIEITQVSQLSDLRRETIVTRTDQTSPRIPEDLDAWSDYDIVLLGRSLQNVITEKSAQQLCEFVAERGGHVVLTRGNPCDSIPEATAIQRALEPIMPVQWSDEPLQYLSLQILAPARSGYWFSDNKMGRSMDDAYARLPGFESMQSIVREKTATVVLVQAQPSDVALGGTQPGIVAMHYGRGSVVGVLGEGTWRWSLLPPEQEELTDVYDMFWSTLVRWLAIGTDFQPGQDISLQLSRNSVRRSDGVIADISCKKKLSEGISPQVRLMAPDGSETLLAVERLPGRDARYRTTLTFSQTGVYRVRVDVPGVAAPTLEKPISVYDINLERMMASAELKGLEQLAQESGGYFFRSDQSRDLHSTLRRHRASLVTPPRLEFVWDRLGWMTMLLSWMGLEWILRRCFDLL